MRPWPNGGSVCDLERSRQPVPFDRKNGYRPRPNGKGRARAGRQSVSVGDTLPDNSLAMFGQHHVHEIPILAPVSSGDAGKSYYGLHHMAGNVAEWVNDWFGFDYYATCRNGTRPARPVDVTKSTRRVVEKSPIMLRTATRSGAPPINGRRRSVSAAKPPSAPASRNRPRLRKISEPDTSATANIPARTEGILHTRATASETV